MKEPIVVCGATGNVGSRIARILLAAGETVRVMGRERNRLWPLAAKGAEPWPGHIGDTAFLGKVFSGARSAFILIPPRYDAPDLRQYQGQVVTSLVSALLNARVPRIVALSSIGAQLHEGTGPILGLHDLEARLRILMDAEVVCLRPGYFMENHLGSIPLIHARGINGSPLRPDVPIPMVAAEDIANTAARLVAEGDIPKHGVRELLGPRDLTMAEATRILGDAIGKPGLSYVQFTEVEARKAMSGMGMSGSAVEAMLEMQRAFNDGKIRPAWERDAESTTSTTLEEFANAIFAVAYRAAA
jgi:uncharacterized protein YbjT (DUF2867 family)